MDFARAVTSGEFGQAVRRAREQRGLNQADLAERLGVTRMTVSRLERGGAVNMETAIRALSECGYETVVVPKFRRVTVEGR
ncbi:helix-turn-helix transcriptional regulator [Nocardia suismassiliense]|uniref:helix-turn-helix transcriptional regulator n=1 Tax=Nocardia suismassiliense TaxID=2077092 RepID=UPI000D1E35D1|nr:helix-turn-helix transcriptional regulator [Nocardia suismassiliense]